MVRLQLALTLLLSGSSVNVEAFHPNNPLTTSSTSGQPQSIRSRGERSSSSSTATPNSRFSSPLPTTLAGPSCKRRSTLVRPVSASASSPSSSEFGDQTNKAANQNLSSLTNAAVDFVVSLDEPDLDAAEIDRRRTLLQNRKDQRTYKVTLPLASKSTTSMQSSTVLKMGISLCQISKGRNVESDVQLNLDTLELEKVSVVIDSSSSDEVMDLSNIQRRIDGEFQGLVVASVVEGSAGWIAGVRPGDVLKTTSATLGPQLWPKSTLEGVKSALLSRKAVSESVQFEFQRWGEVVDNQFELTLTRPIGLEMKETEDGYVEVTGFTEKASNLVQYAVKIGDRVLAVDSSLGDRMWPVSTVEGVVSAVTSRLPGQQITFRFERTSNNLVASANTNVSVERTVLPETPVDTTVASQSRQSESELLERCREVIKRYTTDQKYVNKFSLPGVVADKVVNALASAGTRIDPYTLSMIQSAYLSCKQPGKAIQLFEEAIGLRADGSTQDLVPLDVTMLDESNPFVGNNGKRIVPNLDALDVYTASSLLKAHAMKGDFAAVKRVLAVLEGRSGETIENEEVAWWPGTGSNGELKPNNRCYNIAMSAAADSLEKDGLELALEIFDKLVDPSRTVNGIQKSATSLERDAASYNTIIKALTNNGRHEEAIDIFYRMRRSGIKPDKYSYTSLVKAILAQDAIEEFLYDMRDQGVVADAKFFNTIIRCLCEQKKLSAARKIVTMMEESGVAPDSWTYGFLMSGLIENGNPSAALTLFETACADSRTVSVTENVFLYTNAMTAAAKIGDYTRALEFLSRMKVLGIKPNLQTMTTLVGACLAAGKPELAVDIYHRISNPDSYAVSQGLIAMAESGNLEESLSMLADKKSSPGKLNGKRLNQVYQVLITKAISSSDYDMARAIMKSLLEKGNIPSKAIFQSIFQCMGLLVTKGLVSRIAFSEDGLVKRGNFDELDLEKFKFLLFLVDSVARRNLPCEASLYSIILSYGTHLGGLPKKVATLMGAAKTASGNYSNNKFLIDEESSQPERVANGWEELFVSYEQLRGHISSPASLPKLQVRISSREVPRVLRAEQFITYRKRREV